MSGAPVGAQSTAWRLSLNEKCVSCPTTITQHEQGHTDGPSVIDSRVFPSYHFPPAQHHPITPMVSFEQRDESYHDISLNGTPRLIHSLLDEGNEGMDVEDIDDVDVALQEVYWAVTTAFAAPKGLKKKLIRQYFKNGKYKRLRKAHLRRIRDLLHDVVHREAEPHREPRTSNQIRIVKMNVEPPWKGCKAAVVPEKHTILLYPGFLDDLINVIDLEQARDLEGEPMLPLGLCLRLTRAHALIHELAHYASYLCSNEMYNETVCPQAQEAIVSNLSVPVIDQPGEAQYEPNWKRYIAAIGEAETGTSFKRFVAKKLAASKDGDLLSVLNADSYAQLVSELAGEYLVRCDENVHRAMVLDREPQKGWK